MISLLQDIRYALRAFAKSPGFTVIVVLTLALGIGANTAIFSILDPLLLRNLPIRNPDELVFVGAGGMFESDYDTAKISEERAYQRYRDENQIFSGVLAFSMMEEYNVTYRGDTNSIGGEFVSANYFSLLGVRPLIGRLLQPGDRHGASGNQVAVLSYGYWKRAFDSDPSILGKMIFVQNASYSMDPIQNHSYTIIGVAPPGFFGIEFDRSPDFYVPMAQNFSAVGWVTIIARLKPGISLAQVRASLEPLIEENVKE
ncbi:MAG: ABC transporter permease, partial [Candidatus Acidiferrales bacterium]